MEEHRDTSRERLTLLLHKDHWKADLVTALVLADALGTSLVFVGDNDKAMVRFESMSSRGPGYLCTDTPLGELLPSPTGASIGFWRMPRPRPIPAVPERVAKVVRRIDE